MWCTTLHQSNGWHSRAVQSWSASSRLVLPAVRLVHQKSCHFCNFLHEFKVSKVFIQRENPSSSFVCVSKKICWFFFVLQALQRLWMGCREVWVRRLYAPVFVSDYFSSSLQKFFLKLHHNWKQWSGWRDGWIARACRCLWCVFQLLLIEYADEQLWSVCVQSPHLHFFCFPKNI